MRLVILKILCSITVCLTLAGCGKSDTSGADGSSDGKTQIEFWHYFTYEQAKALDEVVDKFEQENPDIKVRRVYQGNPAALKQKLDGSFASGTNNNPVVSLVYESWVDDFLARGYVDPVNKYLEGPDGLSVEEQHDFVKAFIEGNSWDGKLVTLPFNKSIYLLYANMEALASVGLTTAPATQAQFGDAIRKLTVRQNGRTTSYGLGVMPTGEAFTTLLLARGGQLVAEDGTPTLNSPEALEVLQFLKNLQYPEKHLYVNADYMSVPFANKLISMFVYSSASLAFLRKDVGEKFDYAAAPIPGVEGNEPRYLMQGTNIAIFANKPEPQRQAAWKLVKFLTSPENATAFVTRSGYMPYRYSMLEVPAMKSHMEENPNYALAARLVLSDKGQQEPKTRVWEGVRSEITNMVDTLLSRPDSDPKALLDELQRKAEARMKPKG